MTNTAHGQRALVYIPNPDVVVRQEGDEALLFNPDTDRIKLINATGLFIWNRLDGRRNLGAITKDVGEAFDKAPENLLSAQIESFTQILKGDGFIGTLGENDVD
ncbi:MAG: PqqD family peptide modification chaperone [Deltaproteobacteria bacterium]|nr:PqqD family peptide modification chaperone [Deltaproteobacteria bacterium]MBW2283354.1 PqqD family peptide modification chaperone [Deltaproteobacteria bacterium]